jgi:hypothetical protein
MKKWFIAIILTTQLFISGCEGAFIEDRLVAYKEPPPVERKWTFIVYMAAENDLESAAIADFNELEAAGFDGKPVTALVLFDRGAGYDATNGDWTDTRLFEVKTDPVGNNAAIVSHRLDCAELGLSSGAAVELNMADPQVLSKLLVFAKREYTADNYGLIVWGHGAGWRGGAEAAQTVPSPAKAVAFDDDTGQYMSLSDFGNAVNGQGLSLIAFDTCFGAELEVAYQLRDCGAAYLIASPGITPSAGWDYTAVFDSFFTLTDPAAADFCDTAIAAFKNQYSGTSGTAISKVDLSKTRALFDAFEDYAGILAATVTGTAAKNTMLTAIGSLETYQFAAPSDMYIDLTAFSTVSSTDGAALREALNSAVPSSWSYPDDTATRRMGVFFAVLAAGSILETTHPVNYIKNAVGAANNAFVTDSNNYVPNTIPATQASLLDKLFYSGY